MLARLVHHVRTCIEHIDVLRVEVAVPGAVPGAGFFKKTLWWHFLLGSAPVDTKSQSLPIRGTQTSATQPVDFQRRARGRREAK